MGIDSFNLNITHEQVRSGAVASLCANYAYDHLFWLEVKDQPEPNIETFSLYFNHHKQKPNDGFIMAFTGYITYSKSLLKTRLVRSINEREIINRKFTLIEFNQDNFKAMFEKAFTLQLLPSFQLLSELKDYSLYKKNMVSNFSNKVTDLSTNLVKNEFN